MKNCRPKISRFFHKLFTELFAPSQITCLACDKDVFDGLGFCDSCKDSVVYNNGKTCMRCGVAIDGEEDYCGNCAFDKVYFDRAYSVFSYEGAVRQAILNMKFHNRGTNADVLAKYLVFLAAHYNIEYDCVTFAPMSAKSIKKRGYNQAQLLAKQFCDILELDDKLIEAIVKVRDTEPQENLSRIDRKENLIGAYRINADVKGKRVLVIDDIKTTGATLNECAKVLKRAGATSVVGITVAARKEDYMFEQELKNINIKG